MTNANEPGTFIKDGIVRVAETPADAVKFTYDGFTRLSDAEHGDVTYRELQAAAKAAGIPANQSEDDLIDALAALENEGGLSGTLDQS